MRLFRLPKTPMRMLGNNHTLHVLHVHMRLAYVYIHVQISLCLSLFLSAPSEKVRGALCVCLFVLRVCSEFCICAERIIYIHNSSRIPRVRLCAIAARARVCGVSRARVVCVCASAWRFVAVRVLRAPVHIIGGLVCGRGALC